MKGDSKYMRGRLKPWKERIRTNFLRQEVLYDIYYNATAAPRIASTYKQGKKYHPQVNIEEYKYTDVESQQCSMLSYPVDDDGYFEVQKEVLRRV